MPPRSHRACTLHHACRSQLPVQLHATGTIAPCNYTIGKQWLNGVLSIPCPFDRSGGFGPNLAACHPISTPTAELWCAGVPACTQSTLAAGCPTAPLLWPAARPCRYGAGGCAAGRACWLCLLAVSTPHLLWRRHERVAARRYGQPLHRWGQPASCFAGRVRGWKGGTVSWPAAALPDSPPVGWVQPASWCAGQGGGGTYS